MNEKGLVAGMLYLLGYAQYLPPDDTKTTQTIGSWEAVTYLLATCADVEESVTALTKSVHVAQQEFPPFKQVLPLHYWTGDATGKVVVVEYVSGKLNIHQNSLGSLTNSPPFDWQQINLSDFVNLSPGLRTIELENNFQAEDVTGKAQPLGKEPQRRPPMSRRS